jgi:N-alpha-acetyl-L-2,4-diaminobutyrate deacetylase
MKPSPITPTVDVDRDGVQHGFLRLPHSHDTSAWGAIMIPIAVVKRGTGPTALLTGANHGDEYEGPLALFELANQLKPEEIAGRVIIVPAMNYPAFRVGTRTSPIDKGNLNRSFPGRPDGGVTEKIADYFQRTLLPLADYVLDIHSGGKTLQFLPFAAAHELTDKAQEARCVAAMDAFGAPYSLMLLEQDSVGMYDTAAEAMGKVFVSTELGGGGSATAETAAISRRGVRNFLAHASILRQPPERADSIRLAMPSGDCYVTSETTGLLEMAVDLGAQLRKGDLVARVHNCERTGLAPVEYRAKLDGLLAGRHFPGLVTLGDTIAVIATRAR